MCRGSPARLEITGIINGETGHHLLNAGDFTISGLKEMTVSNPMTKKTIVKKSWKENPIVLMFTLTKWSLLKSPHFLLTALGSSYSFNAILNFYLLLPLHAGSKGFSVEDKVHFKTYFDKQGPI
jgi:hypothetical protein